MKVIRFPFVWLAVLALLLVPTISAANFIGHDDVLFRITGNPVCTPSPCTQLIGLGFDFELDPSQAPRMGLLFSNFEFSGSGPLAPFNTAVFLPDFLSPTSTFGEMFMINGAGDDLKFRWVAEGSTEYISRFNLITDSFNACRSAACITSFSTNGQGCVAMPPFICTNLPGIAIVSQTINLPEPTSVSMILISLAVFIYCFRPRLIRRHDADARTRFKVA